jgi:putative SOS response-associated peptidase YedK
MMTRTTKAESSEVGIGREARRLDTQGSVLRASYTRPRMCGRFTSTPDAAEVAERFGARVPPEYRRRYNVAPAQQVLALVATEEGKRAELMRWGLVPAWAKDLSISYKMINARAETVREKPAYRSLLRSRRCLIPADGFYEWRVGKSGKKEPIRFTLAAEELFAFAGLWARWIDKGSGEIVDSCTIVTTAANELVAPVHGRMPVILRRHAEEAWLDVAVSAEDAVTLLASYPASLMHAAPASQRVNDAREDDPALLVPEPALAA